MKLRTKEEVLEGVQILDEKVESCKTYLNFMMQQMNTILSSEELDDETRFAALYSAASRYSEFYLNQYTKAHQERMMWCNPLTIGINGNEDK